MNADVLSKLLKNQLTKTTESSVLHATPECLPITVEQIRLYTGKDAILAKVHDYVRNDWPSTLSDREK